MRDKVRNGTIAIDLARPVPFVGHMIADLLGSSVAILPFIIVILPLVLVASGTVSYTHLDVYKRQRLRCPCWAWASCGCSKVIIPHFVNAKR